MQNNFFNMCHACWNVSLIRHSLFSFFLAICTALKQVNHKLTLNTVILDCLRCIFGCPGNIKSICVIKHPCAPFVSEKGKLSRLLIVLQISRTLWCTTWFYFICSMSTKKNLSEKCQLIFPVMAAIHNIARHGVCAGKLWWLVALYLLGIHLVCTELYYVLLL